MQLNGEPVSSEAWAALGLVGFGHFTSMRVENRCVRGLSLHLDRLVRDCRTVFAASLDPQRVRDLVRQALADQDGDVVVRVTIFDPNVPLGRPSKPAEPHVLVSFRPAPALPQSPLRLQSVSYSRDIPAVKHVGLFGALHHRAAAQRAGFDDALFVEPDGRISEIATSTIGFITPSGQLTWPEAEVLPGTTRQLLETVLPEKPLSAKTTLPDLPRFAGVVATNAAGGIRAVHQIDNHHWPTDPDIIETLRHKYNSIPLQQI